MQIIKKTGCASVLLWLSTQLGAAPIPTEQLLHPSDAANIELSPDGTRIAALVEGKSGQSNIVVFKRDQDNLTPIFVTRLPENQSLDNYGWLSNDYLSLTFAMDGQTLPSLSIANLTAHTLTVLEPTERIVKTHWIDQDHILIRTSVGCTVAGDRSGTCLSSYNLRTTGRTNLSLPTDLLPVTFLLISETEIYARGSDRLGNTHHVRFNTSTHGWDPIDADLYGKKLKEDNGGCRTNDEQRKHLGELGVKNFRFICAANGREAVAATAHAPQSGFYAFDPRLADLEKYLATHVVGQRISVSDVSEDLQSAMVSVWDADTPASTFFWDQSRKRAVHYELLDSTLQGDFGMSHVERDWVPGTSIAVTLPPRGVPVIGAMVYPFTRASDAGEEPLDTFRGELQAFAQHGIAVLKVLLVMPGRFDNNAAAVSWRQEMADKIRSVVTHASAEIAGGKPVCLFGDGVDGPLALSMSNLPNVACVAVLDAPFQPKQLLGRIKLSDNAELVMPTSYLHREMLADFGANSGDGWLDPAVWAATLPRATLLAFNTVGPLEAVFSRGTGDFRSAAKKAGKEVSLYAPMQSGKSGAKLTQQANTYDTVIDFMAKSLSP